MKSFFTKVGRFFWSRGFLKFILWTATLIIFLYVEENWRGARDWAATKAEWEAKGEIFDYARFIPPPVPDEQNLGAIPLFKLEHPSEKEPDLSPIHLMKALEGAWPGPFLRMGHSTNGTLPDMKDIQSSISTRYATVFKDAAPPHDSLAQFEILYPFLADLRIAETERPLCRFNQDYATYGYLPASRPLGLVLAQMKLSKILTLHALLALDHHQPDLALADLRTVSKLMSGARQDPTLVGSLVAIAMATIGGNATYDGLALHAWNDAQLAEIQEMLKSVNFLADYRFAIRCEATTTIPLIDYLKNGHGSFSTGVSGFGINDSFREPINLFFFMPSGWLDQNKCQFVTSILKNLDNVDPLARRIFPDRADNLYNQVRSDATTLMGLAPHPQHIISTIAALPILKSTLSFAYAQVQADEMRVACALERYHLTHGAYPDSLEMLFPSCINDLPHDIMNGQPYHYQKRPDGTFLLYSVGWNQKDDGGLSVFNGPNPTPTEEGDWVWPTPKTGAIR